MTMLERLIELFRHFHEGIYIVDENRKILYFNPEAEHISGYSRDEVIGKYCNDNILNHIDEKGTRLCIIGCPLKASMDDNEVNHGDIYLHHKDGHRIKVAVRTMPFKTKDEAYGVEVFKDLTQTELYEKKLDEEKVKSLTDPLTALYNRRYLDLLLRGEIELFKDGSHGVLFIDVDNFKEINDENGHMIGDQVLANIASTLRSNISFNDVAIRYGGEEFLLFIKDVSKDDLMKKAEKLRVLVEASFIKLKDRNIVSTVSIGGSLFKKINHIPGAIISADEAQYQVKEKGRNGIDFI